MGMIEPGIKPANPRFSSGPCAKLPNFSLEMLADAPLGRSHRAAVGKEKLKAAIETTREVLDRGWCFLAFRPYQSPFNF